MGLFFDEEPLFRQLFHNMIPSIESSLSLELTRVTIQRAIFIKDVDKFKAVSLAQLVVVEVMCRRQFHSSSAKRRVHIGVLNNFEETRVCQLPQGSF